MLPFLPIKILFYAATDICKVRLITREFAILIRALSEYHSIQMGELSLQLLRIVRMGGWLIISV